MLKWTLDSTEAQLWKAQVLCSEIAEPTTQIFCPSERSILAELVAREQPLFSNLQLLFKGSLNQWKYKIEMKVST